MDFRFLDGVKTAADLKKEKEDMENIKADMISASKNKDKKAIYKYFNGEAIIDSLSMTTDTAKRAKELIKKGLVKLESVEENNRAFDITYSYLFQQDTGVRGVARAQVESDKCDVSIEFERDKLTYAGCNCNRCVNKNRISVYFGNESKNCEHVVATVFLLNAYLDSHELGDETNYFGDSFLSYYDNEESEEGSIKLVPRLILSDYVNGNGLFIQFRIGKLCQFCGSNKGRRSLSAWKK